MEKPNKSPFAALAFFAVLCFALVSCRPEQDPERTVEKAEEKPVTERIISLAPNTTEILFAVGAGQDVVGVTKFCNFPSEVEAIQKVGGLTDPDIEQIIALNPTQIIGVKSQHSDRIEKAVPNVKSTWLKVETIDDVYAAIETIGKKTDRSDRAKTVVQEMRVELEKRSEPNDKRGLVLFGTQPIIAAGPTTFADTFLTLAGASNVLGADAKPYTQLDIEKLIVLNPDFIVDATFTGAELPKSVRAVTEGNVHRMPSADLMRPGPRLPLAADFFRGLVKK